MMTEDEISAILIAYGLSLEQLKKDSPKVADEKYHVFKSEISNFILRTFTEHKCYEILTEIKSETVSEKSKALKELETFIAELYDKTDKIDFFNLNQIYQYNQIQFSPKRGDLLYGISEEIDNYLDKLKISVSYEDYSSFPLRINSYNAGIQNYVEKISRGQHSDKIELNDIEREINPFHDSLLVQLASRSTQYLKDIFASKYSPKNVVVDPEDRIQIKIGREEQPDDTRKKVYFSIRRACKFGIGFIKSLGNDKPEKDKPKIHYLLDGINIAEVLDHINHMDKAPPIVTTELKYLYKHWSLFEDTVLFYRDGKLTDAPWVTDVSSWELYSINKEIIKRTALVKKADSKDDDRRSQRRGSVVTTTSTMMLYRGQSPISVFDDISSPDSRSPSP